MVASRRGWWQAWVEDGQGCMSGAERAGAAHTHAAAGAGREGTNGDGAHPSPPATHLFPQVAAAGLQDAGQAGHHHSHEACRRRGQLSLLTQQQEQELRPSLNLDSPGTSSSAIHCRVLPLKPARGEDSTAE